jgi:DNA-binding NtrC family response regulator
MLLNMRDMRQRYSSGKKGKILFMDDNPHIQEVMCRILERLGHEVDFVREGDGAIAKYKCALEEGKPFNLIIVDLTIKGGRGGKSTMEELLKIDPGIKAIVSSGYSRDPLVAEYKKYGFIDFLVKPYKIEDFVAKIEKHL